MNKETKKLEQEPAFPCLEYNEPGYGDAIIITINGEKNIIPFKEGMSKRFYAACKAMQGILSNSEAYKVITEDADNQNKCWGEMIIKQSYQFADELLKQENE
jgi:hypothetical protein